MPRQFAYVWCFELKVEKKPIKEDKSAIKGFKEHRVSYGFRPGGVEGKPSLLPLQ
jgi:hypothetical protein